MSAALEATRPAAQEKKFGKTSRHVPHHSQKAKKWYPAEDEVQNKKVGYVQNLHPLQNVLL
jgi:large subunit ribosomal protein L6e